MTDPFDIPARMVGPLVGPLPEYQSCPTCNGRVRVSGEVFTREYKVEAVCGEDRFREAIAALKLAVDHDNACPGDGTCDVCRLAGEGS